MLRNKDIAELLVREAQQQSEHVQKALRRAARLAFLWPEEAQSLVNRGRSLTELAGVGPFIAKMIQGWIDGPPAIPRPEAIRADFLTLAEARGILALKPQWKAKLRGDLQMHTDWSDGSGTVEDMAEEALVRGYEYIAITDHSKGLKIAGGIDERELKQQEEEIEAENNRLLHDGEFLRVFKSVELNLNTAGEGDMEPEALARLDIVLGSFHSSLRTVKDQTSRYLAAVRNPDIQILGHPRGRVYNYRLGLSADWPAVFAEAAALDKAVEIDCYPDRQDLSVAMLKLAREASVRVSLGTDAHAPEQLGFMEIGLAAALRARIPAERIVNFMGADAILAWVASVRARSVAVGDA